MDEIERLEVYELGLLLVPTIAEENVATVFGDIKSVLEKNGAVFVSEDYPKMRALAYSMTKTEVGKNEKYNFAYFGWVKYELTTDKTEIVKEEIEKNKNILRFLIVKTVRENTLYSHKLNKKEAEKKEEKEGVPAVEVAPISEEELNKTIDELVVE